MSGERGPCFVTARGTTSSCSEIILEIRGARAAVGWLTFEAGFSHRAAGPDTAPWLHLQCGPQLGIVGHGDGGVRGVDDDESALEVTTERARPMATFLKGAERLFQAEVMLVEPPQLTVETVTPVESELPAIGQEGGSIEAIPRTDPSPVCLA